MVMASCSNYAWVTVSAQLALNTNPNLILGLVAPHWKTAKERVKNRGASFSMVIHATAWAEENENEVTTWLHSRWCHPLGQWWSVATVIIAWGRNHDVSNWYHNENDEVGYVLVRMDGAKLPYLLFSLLLGASSNYCWILCLLFHCRRNTSITDLRADGKLQY